jgi:dCMP deaminase
MENFQDRQRKWDIRFIEMARFVSKWSRDPSTQTGAVIVRPDLTVASVGYNGFPKQMSDDDELYADRDKKYSRIVHCEMNALIHARETVEGYTLYTTGMCCDRCVVHLIQAGIFRFVWPEDTEDMKSRWATAFEKTWGYLTEAGVLTTEIPREALV